MTSVCKKLKRYNQKNKYQRKAAILNKTKLYFLVGVFSLTGLIMSYGACKLDDKGIEAQGAFIKPYEGEMACLLKVMIDHHRKYGISVKNKHRILDRISKIGGFERKRKRQRVEELREIERLLVEGWIMQKKLLSSEIIYTPFQKHGNNPELLQISINRKK